MGKLLSIAIRTGKRLPLLEQTEAQLCPQDGLLGDYASARNPSRQLTLLSKEAWFRALDELDVSLNWKSRRANLLIEGLDLSDTLGKQIVIGDCLLEVTEETLPCPLMESVFPGLRAALRPEWRGGVCTRILRGGQLQIGQTVAFAPTD